VFWVAVAFTGSAPLLIRLFGGSAGSSWQAFACGVFVAFMAKFNDLSEFSLGPLKAKMRETIAEANATLDQLRSVATSMARATLTDMMAGSFMAGMSLATRLQLHDALMIQLRELGVSEKERDLAAVEWRKGICVIYQRIIGNLVARDVRTVDAEKYGRLAKELNAMVDMNTWTAPTPTQLRSFLEVHSLITAELADWLGDYQHFLDTGEIRRRSLFAEG
jgi:hypothetical protein